METDGDAIAEITDKIQGSYANLGQNDLILENHTVGKPCVAKFSEDEAWYRAVITNINGSRVTVRFVDFGNGDTIDRTILKSPTAELALIPCYAIHCSLEGVKADDQQNEEILTVLNNEETTLSMTFITVGKTCNVKLVAGDVDLNAKYGSGVVAQVEPSTTSELGSGGATVTT